MDYYADLQPKACYSCPSNPNVPELYSQTPSLPTVEITSAYEDFSYQSPNG
jgi:hypothetical protein